ncbi:DUF1310 domain-containing protein [Enterococcus plantarum]|uniref:DUF1310 domain-containing protein n=1 Tax=Enterococcus plantarum TaxID=1077675 RepID=A0A2W4BJZ0_9ENTE|nr:DUF1310 family protein [Enterococcus plantarum]MBO0465931.1 DUF1310 domain-containing protein [Enterococcus plantarum]PZL77415.1 hypothetical protein CI088_01670 [Enterococcus plantarum]
MKKDKKEKERALSEVKKIKTRTFYSILGICLVIVIVIGGKVYMDNKRFHDEMVNVVKSGQAKKEIEIGLKNLDSKALTPEGIIKSYEIDYESIEHNPMGGIMYEVVVNQDKDLTIEFDISKDSDGLKNGGAVISEKLSDLLEK